MDAPIQDGHTGAGLDTAFDSAQTCCLILFQRRVRPSQRRVLRRPTRSTQGALNVLPTIFVQATGFSHTHAPHVLVQDADGIQTLVLAKLEAIDLEISVVRVDYINALNFKVITSFSYCKFLSFKNFMLTELKFT